MPDKPSSSILVIGAGPVGLCTAVAFAQAGFLVQVVDRGARGAGWASGGMLGAVFETLGQDAALCNLAFDGLSRWQDLISQMRLEAVTDTVFVARSNAEAAHLADLARDARANMTHTQLPSGIQGLEAWRCGTDVALDPRKALTALITLCESIGVQFIQGTVTHVNKGHARLADGQDILADQIIVATGQGSDTLAASIPELAGIGFVKGQLFAVTQEPAAPLKHVVRSGRVYLLPRGEQIVIGATSDPNDRSLSKLDVAALRDLYEDACVLWPPLRGRAIMEAWSGLRPKAHDGLPLIGPCRSNGVLLACGTYRNGWLFAPAIGARLVALVLDKSGARDQLQPFSPQRFPN